MSRGVYRGDLRCAARRLEYDFVARAGRLHLPPDECPDMTGCIALFTAFDDDVERIESFAGDRLDVIYQREGFAWHARLAR